MPPRPRNAPFGQPIPPVGPENRSKTTKRLPRYGQDESTWPATLFCGIDEAGRGAVLGPLVIAAVFLTRKAADRLANLGVTDSKKTGSGDAGRRRRNVLATEILQTASSVRVAVADAEEVDEWVTGRSLNDLERHLVRGLLSGAPVATRIRADGQRLFEALAPEFHNFSASNHADAEFVEVAAASIVAKTERDRRIAEILSPFEADFGPISGQGYPNQATARFLQAFYGRRGCLPPEVRRSWRWPILAQFQQASLPF